MNLLVPTSRTSTGTTRRRAWWRLRIATGIAGLAVVVVGAEAEVGVEAVAAVVAAVADTMDAVAAEGAKSLGR